MQIVPVAVIRKDLVDLLGDAIEAVVLHQLIYWTKTIHTFDKLLLEEAARAKDNGVGADYPFAEGWIYKSADELTDEVMLGSRAQVARKLVSLEERGYIVTRQNPKYRWDRTKQYRLDLIKLEKDLRARGYTLRAMDIRVTAEDRIEHSTAQPEHSIAHSEQSIAHPEQAIPEITTENTTDTSSLSLPADAGNEIEPDWFKSETDKDFKKPKKKAPPKRYSSKDYVLNGPYFEDPHSGPRGLFAYYMRRIYEVHKIDYEVAGSDINRFVSRFKSMAQSLGGNQGVMDFIDWFLKQNGFIQSSGYTINLLTYTDTMNQFKASKTVNTSPMAKGVALTEEDRLSRKGKII